MNATPAVQRVPAQPALAAEAQAKPKVSIQDLSFYYGKVRTLKGVSLDIPAGRISAFIGPSGCGKSTLLRCINRMYSLYRGQRAEGRLLLDGEDILAPGYDLHRLRARVGMVFQKPSPFPMSIYQNIAFGVRLYERPGRQEMDQRVEESLRSVALWDEVKDKLDASGQSLSGGQQQRLCIARAIAIRPDVLLMDEPTSALDPISTLKVEELMRELKEKYTIAVVTHNMQQAARLSDFTAFMYLGELVEHGTTLQIFSKPAKQQTEDYITGRYG